MREFDFISKQNGGLETDKGQGVGTVWMRVYLGARGVKVRKKIKERERETVCVCLCVPVCEYISVSLFLLPNCRENFSNHIKRKTKQKVTNTKRTNNKT